MWFPDEKMKVNRFKVVAIPRPIEFMRRFGAASTPSSSYTGDEVAPLPLNKVETLASAEALNELQMQNEQHSE